MPLMNKTRPRRHAATRVLETLPNGRCRVVSVTVERDPNWRDHVLAALEDLGHEGGEVDEPRLSAYMGTDDQVTRYRLRTLRRERKI